MEVTTASQSVYDKTDKNRWKFLGVMGIDVTVCNLEDEILKANPSMQVNRGTCIDGLASRLCASMLLCVEV